MIRIYHEQDLLECDESFYDFTSYLMAYKCRLMQK